MATYAGRFGPETLLDGQAVLLPLREVRIVMAGTSTLATLYTDRTKAVEAANPVLTDAKGNLTFFAEPGDYEGSLITNGVVGDAVKMRVFEDPDEETAQEFQVVADLDARDALTGMVDGALALVRKINRTYRWDELNDEWRALDWDSGEVNVLDYGAHWDNIDNSVAFNAAIAATTAGGGTRDAGVIVVPAPFDGVAPQGYQFTGSINLREIDALRFVGRGGNARAGFAHQVQVPLQNVTNTNPIVDSDNDAIAPGLTGAGSTCVSFENFLFYQASSRVFNLSHVVQWVWSNCALVTFGDVNALRVQNSFWLYFDGCSLVNGSSGATAVAYFEGRAGNPDATDTYLVRFQNSRFSGGPMAEYHYNSNSTGSAPSTYSFIDCDTENCSGSVGMFMRVTKEAAVNSIDISDVRFEGCKAYDPSSGSSPWVTFYNVAGLNLYNISFLHSGCAQAGVQRMISAGGNPTGIRSYGGQFLQITTVAGEPATGLRADQEFRFGHLHTGGAAAGGALDLNLPITNGAGPGGYLFAVPGETSARWGYTADGYFQWGDGTSGTPDTWYSRIAAGVLGMKADNCFRTGRNTTANRPSAVTVGKGSQFFDDTLNKPIWSDGSNWRDAAGTVV